VVLGGGGREVGGVCRGGGGGGGGAGLPSVIGRQSKRVCGLTSTLTVETSDMNIL